MMSNVGLKRINCKEAGHIMRQLAKIYMSFEGPIICGGFEDTKSLRICEDKKVPKGLWIVVWSH